MKNLQNNGFCSAFTGPSTKIGGEQMALWPLHYFENYTFATESFKEIYLWIIIEDIQDIVATSTSIFLSGVLMSIESSQKIRHKKIT